VKPQWSNKSLIKNSKFLAPDASNLPHVLYLFDIICAVKTSIGNYFIIVYIDWKVFGRRKHFARNNRVRCERDDLRFRVNPEFKQPYLSYLSERVELLVRIVSQVLK